jgi:hypothetical protein
MWNGANYGPNPAALEVSYGPGTNRRKYKCKVELQETHDDVIVCMTRYIT